MKFLLPILVYIGLLAPSYASPFDLDLSKTYNIPPEIKNFQHFYGDVRSGPIIYLGKKDLSNFETELHLWFRQKKITGALLILGPSGLDDFDCIKKYNNVTKLLNGKYGHYIAVKVEKDTMLEDLIPNAVCDPVRLGLYFLKTFWKTKKMTIISSLVGDEDGFYIEIEYSFNKHQNQKLKKLKKLL